MSSGLTCTITSIGGSLVPCRAKLYGLGAAKQKKRGERRGAGVEGLDHDRRRQGPAVDRRLVDVGHRRADFGAAQGRRGAGGAGGADLVEDGAEAGVVALAGEVEKPGAGADGLEVDA